MAKSKIQGHAALWSFLAEIKRDIHPITREDVEPLYQLFGSIVHYLHPAYKYPYCEAILEMALEALSLDTEEVEELLKDDDVRSGLSDTYSRVVADRVKIR